MHQSLDDLTPAPPQTTGPSALPAAGGERLLRWALSGGVPPLAGADICEPRQLVLHALAFTHGQSNPTYLVTVHLPASISTVHHRFVVRAQPSGNLLPGAHRVDREHRILHALAATHIPVPEVYALCQDASVLGVSFYAMQYISGTVFHSLALPSLTPDDRAAIFSAAVDILAKLRAVDLRAVGLQSLSKRRDQDREHPATRATAVWRAQYDRTVASGAPRDAAVESAHTLLDSALRCSGAEDGRSGKEENERSWKTLIGSKPSSYSSSRNPSLVHGDFRIDNLVFGRGGTDGRPVIRAVLDWELSTLGDPLTDLASLALAFHIPSNSSSSATPPRELAAVTFPTPRPSGIPSLHELVTQYAAACGVSPIPVRKQLPLFVAATFYKLAAVIHGVRARAIHGNAASPIGARLGAHAGLFASCVGHVLRGEGDATDATRNGGAETTAVSGGVGSDPHGKGENVLDGLVPELQRFMDEKVLPLEQDYVDHIGSPDRWTPWEPLERLKDDAKKTRIWNAFLPPALGGSFTCVQYTPLAELMGQCVFAAEVFNCSAPDTGNMELLARFGTPAQRKRWLSPLLAGEIRSCFAMTEPEVASSDATNLRTSIERAGDDYVINGRKWWTSGALDPRCKVMFLIGRGPDPDGKKAHKQHTIVLIPMDSTGVTVKRALTVFGYDDAPHGHAEVELRDVRVPVSESLLLGEGEGFRAAQARLGGGRLHHCMRAVGAGERAHKLLVRRAGVRKAFGKRLADNDSVRQTIGLSRTDVETMRAIVRDAARAVDGGDLRVSRRAIAVSKIMVPRLGAAVIDRAIQVHGGLGMSQDTVLAMMAAHMRTLRMADGPDEAHLLNVAKDEMRAAGLSARL